MKSEPSSELYMAFDQQYITKSEFQDVHDHAGRTFTLLGDSDKACYHSWFYSRQAGLAYAQGQRKKGNLEP